MASLEGRKLTNSLFRSGRCLYQLLACACRSSHRMPNVCQMGSLSSVEQFLQGTPCYWLKENVLVVDLVQPICQEPGSEADPGTTEQGLTGSCTVILEMEKNILRVFNMFGQFLRPVTLDLVLKVLNPIGHPWNMLPEPEEEVTEDSQDHCKEAPDMYPIED
ncbi:hypothetical protein KR009_005083 [Drosophila setifemur]|nr:hypothetical protein KR009_005083 [Drosophila setifemur]